MFLQVSLKTHAKMSTCKDHDHDDEEEDDDDDDGDDDEVGVSQNSAYFTFEMLFSTPRGVTFPTTVTFFVARSVLNEVTPSILEMCFLIFPSQPLQ